MKRLKYSEDADENELVVLSKVTVVTFVALLLIAVETLLKSGATVVEMRDVTDAEDGVERV